MVRPRSTKSRMVAAERELSEESRLDIAAARIAAKRIATRSQPQNDVEQGQREARQPVEDQRALGVRQGGGRELALDLALVGAVIGRIQEKSPHEESPEWCLRAVPEARGHVQGPPALRLQRVHHRAHPTDLHRCIDDAEHEAAEEDHHLDHVGVHHRGHTADGVIDHGDQADEDDGGPQWHAQTDREDDPGRVDAHAGAEPAAHQEDRAQEGPDLRTEAVLEVLVDADQFELPEERDQEDHDEDHRQGHGQLVLEPSESATLLEGHERGGSR